MDLKFGRTLPKLDPQLRVKQCSSYLGKIRLNWHGRLYCVLDHNAYENGPSYRFPVIPILMDLFLQLSQRKSRKKAITYVLSVLLNFSLNITIFARIKGFNRQIDLAFSFHFKGTIFSMNHM